MPYQNLLSKKHRLQPALILLLLFPLFGATVYSQQPGTDTSRRKLNFLVDVQYGPLQNASVHKTLGNDAIKPQLGRYLAAGFSLRSRLPNNYFLLYGVLFHQNSRVYYYNAPTKSLSPENHPGPFHRMEHSDIDFIGSVPLLLEKNWQQTKKRNAFVVAGINIRYAFSYDGRTASYGLYNASNQLVNALSLTMNVNNNRKPWIGYNMGGGYEWRLRNTNVLRVGLMANVSTTHFVKGTYTISLPNEPVSTGTYRFSGNTIGLSVSYGLTSAIRKKAPAKEPSKAGF